MLPPTVEGLAGNGRTVLFIDKAKSNYPFTTYRVWRKIDSGAYYPLVDHVGHVWMDTQATNGHINTYKVGVLGNSGEEGTQSSGLALEPSADNPVVEATFSNDYGLQAAKKLVNVDLAGFPTTASGEALYVDGNLTASGDVSSPHLEWQSESERNGAHTLVAVVWMRPVCTGLAT